MKLHMYVYVYVPFQSRLVNFNVIIIHVAATVSFIQLPYIVNEDDGAVQTVLIFSNEVSYSVTFDVIQIGGTATGK